MTTWATITAELSLFLDDSGKTAFADAVRLAAFNRAQELFAITHTATVSRKADLVITDGTTFPIPSDLIEIAGVRWRQDANSKWVWLRPAERFATSVDADDGYVVLGSTIQILSNRTNSDLATANIELWYYSGYTKMVADATVATLPFWAEWAVLNLCLAYLMYPLMVGQADLRRFQTKRDAGEPEDNPPKALAIYYARMYELIVSQFKKQDRSVGYSE